MSGVPEYFYAEITNTSIPNATITDDIGVVTIRDNDQPATLCVNPSATELIENDIARFEVSLSGIVSGTVPITASLVPGSISGEGREANLSDFDATSLVFDFTLHNNGRHTIDVKAVEDGMPEGLEYFHFRVNDPDHPSVELCGSPEVDMSVDDDPSNPANSPVIQVNVSAGPAVTESDDAEAKFTITVDGDIPAHNALIVPYHTADVTAESAHDYRATGNSISFESGDLPKTVTVGINDDSYEELTETFELVLGDIRLDQPLESAQIRGEGRSATMQILDDDLPPGENAGHVIEFVHDDEEEEHAQGCCQCGCGHGDAIDLKDGSFSLGLDYGGAGISYHSSSIQSRNLTAVKVTLAPGIRVPDRMELRFSTSSSLDPTSRHQQTRHISTGNLAPGGSFLVPLKFTDTSQHDFLTLWGEVQLFSTYGEETQVQTHSGPLAYRDRINYNPIAPGFAFDEVSRLTSFDSLANGAGDHLQLLRGSNTKLDFTAVPGTNRFEGTEGNDSIIDELFDLPVFLDELRMPAGHALDAARTNGVGYVLTRKYGTREIYNSEGLQLYAVDTAGNVTAYEYDDYGANDEHVELSKVIDPAGQVTEYHYTTYPNSDAPLIDRITSPEGVTDFDREWWLGNTDYVKYLHVEYPDPGNGRPTERFAFELSLDSNFRVSEHRNTSGQNTTFEYDNQSGSLVSVTQPDGSVIEVASGLDKAYPDVGNGTAEQPWEVDTWIGSNSRTFISSMTDESGYVTTYELDHFGNILEMVDPLGNVYSYNRNEDGQVVDAFEPDPDAISGPGILTGDGPLERLHTHYDYDNGNLREITYPDGTTELWEYDAVWNIVTRHVDELGRTTTYEIDPDTGLVLSETLQLSTPIGNDHLGNPAAPWQNQSNRFDVDANELMEEKDFDILIHELNNREYSHPDGHLVDRQGHDDAPYFDVAATGEQLGLVGSLDAVQVNNALRANALITSYEYTTAADGIAGQLKWVKDPMGRTTTYTYYDDVLDPHKFGKLQKITYPNLGWMKYTYDLAGNVDSVTDHLGRVTTYTYDGLDRLETVTGPDQDGDPVTPDRPLTSHTYTASGQLETVTDPLGKVTKYVYDSEDRLFQTIDDYGTGEALNITTSTMYDVAGNARVSIDPLGRFTLSNYDPLGRLVSQVEHEPSLTGIQTQTWKFWQNPIEPKDVNGDGNVDDLDRSLLDEYVAVAFGPAPSWPSQDVSFAYYNVNGDEWINQVDLDAFDGLPGAPITLHTTQNRPIYHFAYDNVGNLIAETDPNGNVTQYRYDARHRRIRTIQENPDPDQGPTTVVDLSTPLDQLELVLEDHPITTTVYDDAGQVFQMIDPLGRLTEYVYDSAGRQVEMQLPQDAFLPDADSDPIVTTPVYKYAYDKAGNRVREIDPRGVATEYDYHPTLDAVSRIILPDPDRDGPTTPRYQETLYDSAGRVFAQRDNLQQTTNFYYDWHDNTVRIDQPHVNDELNELFNRRPRLTYTYDVMGNRLSEKDPNGNLTEYQYDRLHRLQFGIGANPNSSGPQLPDPTLDPQAVRHVRPVTESVYDDAGQLIKVIDPLERESVTEYDGLGRVTKSYAPDPTSLGGTSDERATVSYEYDVAGNLTKQEQLGTNIDPREYEYDRLNRTVKESRHSGEPIIYEYDDAGNQVTLIDPLANKWSWTYTNQNRIKTKKRVDDTTDNQEDYEYDLSGNLVMKSGYAYSVKYYYDDANRLTDEIGHYDPVAGSATDYHLEWEYDQRGRVKSTSSEDYTYTYRYDALNRVDDRTIEIVGTTNSVVAIDDSYDLAGNRNRTVVMVDSVEDHTNTYWYDRLNRLRSIHQHENASTAVTDKLLQFDYDLANQQEVTWRKVGTDLVSRTDFGYDWTGRLDTLDHEFGTSSTINYTWGYDRANRLTSFTFLNDAHGESVSQYDYSQRNELETVSRAVSSNLGDEAYDFDENGNRLIGGNPTVDEYNQLTTYGDNGYTYLHGLLVRKVTPAGSLTYTWDARNRLYEFKSHPDGTTVQYGYDASNQLVSRELSGSSSAETHFIYDQGQVILQLDATAGEVSNRYVWGPSVDQLLAEEAVDTATSTSEVSWPLADNQGTIRDWIDSDGALLQHIAYDSFGNQLDPLTGNPLPSSEIDHLFAYTGRMFDPASGLQNNLNRWYDPEVGRWISEDPIGFAAGDANLYRYVGNSPTNYTDPDGLERRSANDFYILDVTSQRIAGPRGRGRPGPWGDFGYTINWLVSPKAVKAPRGSGLSNDSWIVQHVQVTFDVKDKNGNPVKHPADDGNWDYWEAWYVGPGKRSPGGGGGKARDDWFSIFGGPKDTQGRIVFRATAQFYPNTTLPATFRFNNPNTHAGSLRSTTDANPMAGLQPRSFPPTYHGVVVEWDCTGKTTVTPITTSRSVILDNLIG